MKKALLSFGTGALLFGAMTMSAFAATEHLNWGSQLNSAQCQGVGAPIVNVTQQVRNDVDSGFGGYWAFDDFSRKIQVWATSEADVYCATVSYQGQFSSDAFAGDTSPGTTGILTGDERGTFEGGYTGTITGTPLATPLWPTHGSVGTTDYMCDTSGICPGYIDWVTQYFPVDTFSYDFWGWIYHGGKYGTWVNASTGSSGDVIEGL